MARKSYTDTVLKVTDGLIGTVTDLMLLNIYFLIQVGGVKTMGDASRVVDDVHGMLDTVNYKTIKKALYNLRSRGLIAHMDRTNPTAVAITNLGKQRIEETIPTYKVNRPWDKHIYLISYDILTKANKSRDMLREYIRRTGGTILQESLWVNPYNPSLLLKDFVEDHAIPGTVLVSKLGHDGTVGEETLPDLIMRIYGLDTLAQRYEEFLETYRRPASTTPKTTITIDYLAILKDDPQLPFPLLPKDFPAEKAWRRYQELIRS